VQLDDLTLGYQRHLAVHHVAGAFSAGSLTAIVGPNGAGKSTLLKGIMGLLKPLQGGVTLCGLPRQAIAYLPQQAEIDRSFPISVLDTVLLGHWRQVGAFRAMSPAMRDEAHAALTAVGLSGFENRPIGTLSSGQFQRVLFARTLLQDARLILLDEPFTAIDARTTADLPKVVSAVPTYGSPRWSVPTAMPMSSNRHRPMPGPCSRATFWSSTAWGWNPGCSFWRSRPATPARSSPRPTG
jgi:zinc/manganese transport system ATP-binding protein